ncbi:MAG: flagellar assembly protein FliW [candidate division KSB1 bacterium]|nr:flagellar assembly protein FliW [candidate division KSB1 bacterium]
MGNFSQNIGLIHKLRQLVGAKEGIQILVVVNFFNDNNLFRITANLLAPIIINVKKRLAKQVILYESQYPHRYPLPLKTHTDLEDGK